MEGGIWRKHFLPPSRDSALQRLFDQVAQVGSSTTLQTRGQPLVFTYIDASGSTGATHTMDGLRDADALAPMLKNMLLAALRMRCRSRDWRGVLPGAAERVGRGWKRTLLELGCVGGFLERCLPMLGTRERTLWVEWVNARELYSFGSGGAVPVFDGRGDLVCVIGATGEGDTSARQAESAVDEGLRHCGLEETSTGNGWVWHQAPTSQPPSRAAAGAAAGQPVELADAMRLVEASIGRMRDGDTKWRMYSALRL
eukprot:5450601-Prymnesium_polylepis.1